MEFVWRVLGAFLEVLGRSLDSLLRVLRGSRRNLGRFMAGSLRFSVDSLCICSGLLLTRLGWHWAQFLESWTVRSCRNGARMAQKGSQREPKRLQHRSKNEAFFVHHFWKLPRVLAREFVLPFSVHFWIILEPNIDAKTMQKSNGFLMRFLKHFGYENEPKIDARIHPKLIYFSCEIWE